jgi:hypothetical protein
MKSTTKLLFTLISIPFLIMSCQTEISVQEMHETNTPEQAIPTIVPPPVIASTSTAIPGWEAYKWTTIEEIIETHLPYVEEAPNGLTLFGINESKYRVHVTYLGESRPVTEDHYALLSAFLQIYFPPDQVEHWLTQYQEEFLMQEGEATYWMPCQVGTADRIRQYIQPNTEMTVYITYPGTNAFHRPLDWVFWIMEWDYY